MSTLVLSAAESILLDVLLALAVHLVYNRLEITPDNFFLTAFALGLPPSISSFALSAHLPSPWLAVTASYFVFYTTLASSIVLYRLSPLHPLASYPGPVLARVSKLHMLWSTMCKQQHVYLKELHDRYGDYVRVGPNELSFANVESINPILGPNGMPKGPLWSGRAGKRKPLIAMTDTREHAQRRKTWNRAFSQNALRQYEPLLRKRALQLVEELERRCKDGMGAGARVDLAQWLSYFSFDFMFDMAFGGGFELMAEGDTLGLWHMMERAIDTFAVMQNIPWASGLLYKLPVAIEGAVRFIRFARAQAELRRKRPSAQQDLFTYLNDEDGYEKHPPTNEQVLSDGGLAIAAGSDTTATVLAGACFFLLSHPHAFTHLRAELDSPAGITAVDTLSTSALAELPYLNAVIEEAMRLQPAVPTALQRAPAVGSGGHVVGIHFIPEGTAVYVPPYVLHRDARYFSPYPESFIPERWLSSLPTRSPVTLSSSRPSSSSPPSSPPLPTSSTRHNTAAYIPFSYGPANCAGRALARTEMRVVLALLVRRFELRLADEYDTGAWARALRDLMVIKTGSLPVVVGLRSGINV